MSSAQKAEKLQQRIRQLESFLEEVPDDTFTRFALALEYLKAGRNSQAELIFVDIAEKQPDYSGVYYHLGKLYEEKQQYEDAFATYSSGIEVCQRLQELHALRELQQAQAALKEALDEE